MSTCPIFRTATKQETWKDVLMVKARRGSSNNLFSKSCTANRRIISTTVNSRKKGTMSISSVFIWSLALFHVLNCFNWVMAGEDTGATEGEDVDLSYGNTLLADSPFVDWSSNPPPFRPNKWGHFPGISPFMIKNKRAVFGILGLATKRPHKTAAEIQYLPPQDSFMSVRGRKKRSPVPISSVTLPPTFDIRRRKVSVPERIPPTHYYTENVAATSIESSNAVNRK